MRGQRAAVARSNNKASPCAKRLASSFLRPVPAEREALRLLWQVREARPGLLRAQVVAVRVDR